MTDFRGRLSDFLRCEDGIGSWFSLVPLIFVLIILGLGLDISNAIQQRTHLQITADAAAHAAIVTRDSESEANAKAAALGIAALNMPPADDGNVLRPVNIEFGVWSAGSRTFTPSVGSREAVRVITEQREANNNPVATYLLRLAGFNSWDIRALTTMEGYYRDCNKNGFIAEGVVDIQSNNEFRDGFCIHSNEYVEVNQNNFFELGTSVTMPNEGDLKMPASGFAQNDGLQEALGSSGYTIKEVAQLDTLIAGLNKESPDYVQDESPEFLLGISGVVDLGVLKDIQQSDLQSGKVNRVSCSGQGQVNVKRDTVFDNLVLITSCKLKFESGVILQDSIVATTNTDARSISGPSGIRIGADDFCAAGGGAQILTMGGAQFGAGLEFHSGQIIARGDVQFPARDFSIEGASVLAGGRIDGTSNLSMAFCGSGADDSFKSAYFRIVQ